MAPFLRNGLTVSSGTDERVWSEKRGREACRYPIGINKDILLLGGQKKGERSEFHLRRAFGKKGKKKKKSGRGTGNQ